MYRHSWSGLRKHGWASGLILLLVITSQAQTPVGDNLNMTLNGFLGGGYSGNYNDGGASSHGLNGSGTANFSGSYYSPNFLSFNIHPFYNRNQDNAAFSSVLSETGIDASVNLFGGSHFPGSVTYGRLFANGSQYGITGTTTGLTSDSSTRNFSVSWSELLPSLPQVTATFADSSTSSTIQGLQGTSDTSSRIFSVLSHYKVDGWGLQGYVNHQNISVSLPIFLSPTSAESISSGTSYGASAVHSLPWSGSFVASFNRTSYSSETSGYQNNGTTDNAEATASFRPIEKFTILGQVRYTSNLIGALQQSLQPGAPPLPNNDQGSHDVSLNSYGTYNIGHGFILIGYASQNRQTFQGTDSTFTRAGGTLTYSYSKPLFGMLYLSFGMVNNAANSGSGNLGFVGNVSFKRHIAAWEVDSDFSYAQNTQTIISYYTSSNISYGGMLRRRFAANSFFSASYRGLQTGLTQLAGYDNRTDTFLSVFSRGRFGFSGSYAKSHGTALLSSTGVLTPTPLAAVLAPDQAIYDGKVYGAGMSVIPMRKMLINLNWYKTQSDTLTSTIFSNNNSDRLYGQMQYNLRKLSFRAGYWRVYQGISASGLSPQTVNTYYFNISRWFSFF
jgi:hypothetical protein